MTLQPKDRRWTRSTGGRAPLPEQLAQSCQPGPGGIRADCCACLRPRIELHLGQETRRQLRVLLASALALARPGQRETALRTGDGDIHQAALLLNAGGVRAPCAGPRVRGARSIGLVGLVGVVRRAAPAVMRQQALLAADDEHVRELETLGRMD